MDRDWRREVMKPMHRDFLAEMEMKVAGSSIAMEVDDDLDSNEMFDDGVGPLFSGRKLDDADFFNKFEDDFDDSDIN